MSILDGIKKIFVPQTTGTAGASETTETKASENVESNEAKELASAKTNENELADVEISENEETSSGTYSSSFIEFWNNTSVIGRMISKGENIIEANINVYKEDAKIFKKIGNGIKDFFGKVGNFFKRLFGKK